MRLLATILSAIIATAAIAASSRSACPALSTPEPTDTAFHLDEVVVTATRTPKPLKDVPIQTRLITAADIARTDATDIHDLLQQELPGAEFSYAMNQQLHFNMGGFGGQGILFLVDGERLAGETLDNTDFARLTMAGVERIEIVRGASSALYGSSAVGGVVNIITREGGAPWELNVNTRLSRHNGQRHGALWSVNRPTCSNMLDLTFTDIDNFNVSSAPNPVARVYSTVYGDKTFNARERFIWRPSASFRLKGRASYFYRTLTRTPDMPERYRDFAGGLHAVWDISSSDRLDVAYSFDQYDKSVYQKHTHLDIRDYSNVQNTLRAVYNHDFANDGKRVLTLGADAVHDYLKNSKVTDGVRKQDTFDAFAQMDWTLSPQWELVGALRYDYFSLGHESRLTPKLTACYRPRHNLALRMSYGMGFRAPTLKEKYYSFDMAGIWIVEGNEQLTSETSHNLNISAEWTRRNYNLTLSTYYHHVANKLATGLPHYKPGDNTQLYLNYLNLDNYSVCGAEATLQARWEGGFSARFSYAYTKEHLPKDHDGNTVNNQYIPAREHSVNAHLDWHHRFTTHYALNATLSGRFLSAVTNLEYADYYNIDQGLQHVPYPAYTLWKLSTTQHIGKAVRLTIALDNLLNYQPRYYYMNAPATDGTNLQVGLAIDIHQAFPAL